MKKKEEARTRAQKQGYKWNVLIIVCSLVCFQLRILHNWRLRKEDHLNARLKSEGSPINSKASPRGRWILWIFWENSSYRGEEELKRESLIHLDQGQGNGDTEEGADEGDAGKPQAPIQCVTIPGRHGWSDTAPWCPMSRGKVAMENSELI